MLTIKTLLISAILFFYSDNQANLINLFDNSPNMQEIINEYQPNEMGQVMVVMYHNLVEKEEDEGHYARAFENFEKDLIRIHTEGYIPITMDEWINGNFDVPAGKTPIILTFDDGHPTDIQLDENGKPTDKCVVGIMEKVHNEYPDFIPKATFYLNGPYAFGDSEYDMNKINYLLENGYEIGNHTSNHENISEITLDEAKEEIISEAKRLEKITKSKSFNFAVPFGEKPDNYQELVKGDWLGDYTMTSSVNVGWNPIDSIYDKDFNVHDINRVTCGEDPCELYFWMDSFKNAPETRFISDGIKDIITFPKSKLDRIYTEPNSFPSSFDKIKYIVYDDESLEIFSVISE